MNMSALLDRIAVLEAERDRLRADNDSLRARLARAEQEAIVPARAGVYPDMHGWGRDRTGDVA